LINKHQEDLVCTLKQEGMNHRDISEAVWGVRTRASTVHYILKRRGLVGAGEVNPHQRLLGAPKVLVFDIETAPCLSYHWGLWQQNIGLNMMVRDWAVISWSAKWVGEDEVMYQDCRGHFDGSALSIHSDINDAAILESIWRLLNDADIVVTQNGKKFDVKKLNARFLHHGMRPPSSYKHIDTLQIAKRHFAFTSNKLEYMTDRFCTKYKKLKHGKFPGFELWKQCQLGNHEAWDEMEEYNQYDVLSLEELVFVLAPWSNQIPNLDMYHNENENVCFCGNHEWEHTGYAYTNLSKFDKFACTNCGAEKRGRINLLTKEKRVSLRMNVL
tara:strand:+ start:19430 stop:20413 length:984 start_codon:yes stop_codon:yes gene_type:complete